MVVMADVLVAEEQNLVPVQACTDLGDGVGRERASKIDALDLGPQHRPAGLKMTVSGSGRARRVVMDCLSLVRRRALRRYSAATAVAMGTRARLGRPSIETGTSPASVTRRMTRRWSP